MEEKQEGIGQVKNLLEVARENLAKAKSENMGKEPYADRLKTSFGVSIGLGLALESLFPVTHDRIDKDRKPPEQINIEKYNIIAVNVHAVAKDVFHSIAEHATEPNKLLSHPDFETTILNELTVIEGLFFGVDKEVVFYLPDFSYIASKLNAGKKGTFTKRFTTNLMIYKALEKMKLDTSIEIQRGSKLYKLHFKSYHRVLMLTSFPYDLLNHGNIELLEFHTGALIKKDRFNKKYKQLGTSKPYNMLPFDEMLLYLLGDNAVSMLHQHGEKIRKIVHECMVNEKWTPLTSIIRINQTLSKYPIIKNALNNFNRLY